jgi:hypothetical protein
MMGIEEFLKELIEIVLEINIIEGIPQSGIMKTFEQITVGEVSTNPAEEEKDIATR